MAKTTKTGVLTTPTAKATTVLEDSSPVLPLPDTPQGVMAVGPQVSLRFIKEAYNQANSYNYYDVVNVDGTSYIALQNVPANTPITDTDYWVKWNDPNAQFSLLQTTVEQFDGRITENANDIAELQKEKVIVVIGDSWTENYKGSVSSDTGMITMFKQCLPNYSVRNYGQNGAGFVNNNPRGNNFNTLLTEAINDPEFDNSDVCFVLLVGGCNDIYTNKPSASIQQAIEDFQQRAYTNFPNSRGFYFPNMVCPANAACIPQIVNALSGQVQAGWNGTFDSFAYYGVGVGDVFTDTRHLMPNAQLVLGKYLASKVEGNTTNFALNVTFNSVNLFTPADGLTINQGNLPLEIPLRNFYIYLTSQGFEVTKTNMELATLNDGSFFKRTTWEAQGSNLYKPSLMGTAFCIGNGKIDIYPLRSNGAEIYIPNTTTGATYTTIYMMITCGPGVYNA